MRLVVLYPVSHYQILRNTATLTNCGRSAAAHQDRRRLAPLSAASVFHKERHHSRCRVQPGISTSAQASFFTYSRPLGRSLPSISMTMPVTVTHVAGDSIFRTACECRLPPICRLTWGATGAVLAKSTTALGTLAQCLECWCQWERAAPWYRSDYVQVFHPPKYLSPSASKSAAV